MTVQTSAPAPDPNDPTNFLLMMNGVSGGISPGPFGLSGVGGVGSIYQLFPGAQRGVAWSFELMKEMERRVKESQDQATRETTKREYEEYLRNMEGRVTRKVIDTDDEPWVDPPKGHCSNLRKNTKGKPYSAAGYKPSKPEPKVIKETEIVERTKRHWRFHWTKDKFGGKYRLRLYVEEVAMQEGWVRIGYGDAVTFLLASAFMIFMGIYNTATDGWAPLTPAEALTTYTLLGAISAIIGVYMLISLPWRLRWKRHRMMKRYLKERFGGQLKGYGVTDNISW